MGIEMRPMEFADIPEAVSLVSAAFADSSALYNYLTKDRNERLKMLNAVFNFRIRGIMEHAAAVDLAVENGKMLGFAAWDRPSEDKLDVEEVVKHISAALADWPEETLEKWKRFHRVLFTAFGRVRQPYWDMGPIAVHPDAQGRGVCSALLRKQLAVIDTEGLPCILGTQDDKNTAIYRRFGFEIVSRDPVSAPELFTYIMRRKGKAAGSTRRVFSGALK
jgi:ribosomal protein S18 acetylase RimI-like enzyme